MPRPYVGPEVWRENALTPGCLQPRGQRQQLAPNRNVAGCSALRGSSHPPGARSWRAIVPYSAACSILRSGAALPRRRRRPGRHGLRPAAPQLADNASDRFTAACTGHREPPLGDRVLRGDGDGTLLWSTRSTDPATSIRGTPCREARIEHTRAPRRGPEASGQGARHARSLRRSSSRHSIVAERPRGLLVLVALARRLVLSLLDDA